MTDCDCATWDDDQRVPMGFGTPLKGFYDVRFAHVIRRTPWLDLSVCNHCGEAWYVALDTVADEYRFHRLDDAAIDAIGDGVWPDCYEGDPHLWPPAGDDDCMNSPSTPCGAPRPTSCS